MVFDPADVCVSNLFLFYRLLLRECFMVLTLILPPAGT